MRILVIERGPFGTLIDAAKLCEYVGRDHSVTYLSFNASLFMNQARDEVSHPFVKLVKVQTHPKFIVRSWRWFLACLREVREDYDVVCVYHFRGCSLLRCVRPRRPMILDIRSGGVSPSAFKRRVANMTIRFDAKFFRNVAIISDGLRRQLGIAARKAHILPLGADTRSNCPRRPSRTFTCFTLGTFIGFASLRHLFAPLRGYVMSAEAALT